jgi:thiol-disulfide isomerase/thioredoxin
MITLKSEAQLEEMKQKQCILLFSADWCPDCRVIEHFLPEIEATYPEYPMILIDRDAFLDVCIEHGITGIPSFIVYKAGEVKGTFISKLRKTKQEILDFLNNATK